MAREQAYQIQGQQGGIVLTGTDGADGPFRWIQFCDERGTVLAVGAGETAGNLVDIDNLDSRSFPAGSGIGGVFSRVELASGTVIAYYE
jgi:hypothetical protein